MFLPHANGRIRLTMFVCVVLVCDSFASAAVLHMGLDRMHALSQAALFGQRGAQEMATDVGATLDRYEPLGRAFASTEAEAKASTSFLEAGGRPLRNIAILDRSGRLESEMKAVPALLLPLRAGLLAQAHHLSLVVPAADGRSFFIRFAMDA